MTLVRGGGSRRVRRARGAWAFVRRLARRALQRVRQNSVKLFGAGVGARQQRPRRSFGGGGRLRLLSRRDMVQGGGGFSRGRGDARRGRSSRVEGRQDVLQYRMPRRNRSRIFCEILPLQTRDRRL